jgi:hypothetical protein
MGPHGAHELVSLFLLISEEFPRSHLLLLRMVLVFLPMEPRLMAPSGAPLGGANL